MAGLGAISGVLANTAISVLILLTVFAGLAGAERIAGRFRDRKREQRQQSLRQQGLSANDLETLEPFVEYEIKHYSWFRPILGVVAAASLVFLATRSSNRTGLVYAYGSMGLVFGILAVVELRRFLRARRVHRRLETDADGLAAADDPFEAYEFLRPEEVLTLGPDDD
jgi:hypothetical protein